jgi:hypothetical protein
MVNVMERLIEASLRHDRSTRLIGHIPSNILEVVLGPVAHGNDESSNQHTTMKETRGCYRTEGNPYLDEVTKWINFFRTIAIPGIPPER